MVTRYVVTRFYHIFIITDQSNHLKERFILEKVPFQVLFWAFFIQVYIADLDVEVY